MRRLPSGKHRDEVRENRRCRYGRFLTVSMVVLFIFGGTAYSQSSPNYIIETHVISGGGGEGTSTNYDLFHIIGQPSAIGTSSSTNYINHAGFFSGGAPSPINPRQGTLGTEITITGLNFGTKKGKVLIGSTPLTIIDWADGLIHCRLTKVLDVGTYDVTIQPKEPKGVAPIIEKNAFTVKAAEIDSIEQGEGSANDQVTVTGKFFGTKKGAVYLEYGEGENLIRKSCKVSSWTMDPTTGDSEIVFVVPTMLPEVCDVVVDAYGVIPETNEHNGFEVKAPEIKPVNPNSGSVGEQITISGNFFGSQKGKVYLGYVSKGKPVKKSCSVVNWSDDEIVFIVPKLPVGAYDVIVTNVVGSAQYGQKFNIE